MILFQNSPTVRMPLSASSPALARIGRGIATLRRGSAEEKIRLIPSQVASSRTEPTTSSTASATAVAHPPLSPMPMASRAAISVAAVDATPVTTSTRAVVSRHHEGVLELLIELARLVILVTVALLCCLLKLRELRRLAVLRLHLK